MAVTFQAKPEYFTFHDPMQDGKLIDRKTEVRFDPLTGETSRILFDSGASFTPPDYSHAAETTGGKSCPFCSENVYASTPAFPNELIEGGRFVQGEAVGFPNLFPYSKHNAVIRICDQHYTRLEDFTVPMIMDAFSVSHDYLQKVIETDSTVTHASINWNYLPPSGGSLLHPHFHVLASEQQTRYQALTYEHGQRFYEEQKENYYLALLNEERRLEERWIGHNGSLHWTHAYAPRSHYDFVGMFEDVPSISALNEQSYQSLAESMLNFFKYFAEKGLASFNLAMFIPIKPTPASWTHIRLIPRVTIGALDTSDMNVFNYVHQEALSLKAPEKVAQEVWDYF